MFVLLPHGMRRAATAEVDLADANEVHSLCATKKGVVSSTPVWIRHDTNWATPLKP